VYGTYITGALVLDVDASGDAYVAGFAGGGFPVSAGAFEQCYNANDFAAEFSPAGALIAATYFGAPATASLGAIAAGPNGLVTIASAAGNIVANFQIDNPLQQDGPCMSLLVENAASYANSYPSVVAAGELVTLQGAGIGPATGAVPATSPYATAPLPTELAGVQVFFDEIAAPLMYVQSDQINVVVPWEIAGQSSTQVHVTYNAMSSNAVSLGVLPIAPGLFYLNSPGVPLSQGAILNADGSINTPANCAHPGDEIALFGTGGGPTSPAGVTGAPSGLNANTLLTAPPVTVQIGGGNAPVFYAGAAPGLVSGVFQINVVVPASIQVPNPFASVDIQIGHQAANAITMCVGM
jgi:uncharacterized protein (TIGR03437 family)